MRIREEFKEQIRLALLKAGTELIEEQGLEATTVEAITSRAGVAKGTFYNYFKTKDDLIYAAVQEGFRDWEDELERLMRRRTTTYERLQEVFQRIIAWTMQHPELSWIWMIEGLRRVRSAERGRAPFQEIMRRIFAAGQKSGEIRADRPADELALDLSGLFLIHVARAYYLGQYDILRQTFSSAIATYLQGALAKSPAPSQGPAPSSAPSSAASSAPSSNGGPSRGLSLAGAPAPSQGDEH